MQKDSAPYPAEAQDFNQYRIAQVRISNTTEWKLCGSMFTPAFLFPSGEQDSSLTQLTEIQGVLNRTCTSNKLDFGTLGTVERYT